MPWTLLLENRTMHHALRAVAVPSAFSLAAPASGIAADLAASEGVEFFETRIRPVLMEPCYKCHNSKTTAEGSLTLDDRAGLLKCGEGGEGGAIVVHEALTYRFGGRDFRLTDVHGNVRLRSWLEQVQRLFEREWREQRLREGLRSVCRHGRQGEHRAVNRSI